MNPPMKLLDYAGTSGVMDFSTKNYHLLYSSGSIIIFYNIKTNSKTFITYHQSQITDLKFINNDTQFISIDNSNSPLLILWELYQFRIIASFEIKTNKNFKTIMSFVEKISRDKFLILLCGENQNLLFSFNSMNMSVDFLCDNVSIPREICGFKTFYNSNDFVLMTRTSLQYYRLGSANQSCMINEVKFPFGLVGGSLRVNGSVNLLSFLTEKGGCLIYDQNANGKPAIIPIEQEIFCSCDFNGDTLACGTETGKIYFYNIYDNSIKFVLNGSGTSIMRNSFSFNDKGFRHTSLWTKKIFVDEKNDTIFISSGDNSVFVSSINRLLKFQNGENQDMNSIINYSFFSFNHFDKITMIEPSFNESIFYTSSRDQSIIAYNFEKEKIYNFYFNTEKISSASARNFNGLNRNQTYISALKIHPLYTNKLFAGDNKGTLYLFDTKENVFQYNKFIIGTFAIVNISFNDSGNLICIGFDTGMNVICDLNNNCEFCAKICEHFLTPSEIEQRKINNQKMSYLYFFKGVGQDALIYLKSSHVLEVGSLVNFNLNVDRNIQQNYSIVDVDVHTSQNYVICLLESNCICINNIYSGELTGIIDLNDQISYTYNFTVDPSGLFLGVVCELKNSKMRKDSIIFFEIGTGKVQCCNCGLFPISRISFDKTGVYLGIAGEEGDFSIWGVPENMKTLIWNICEEMKINPNFWEQYEIRYDESDFKNSVMFGSVDQEIKNLNDGIKEEKKVNDFNRMEENFEPIEHKVENIFEKNLQNSETFKNVNPIREAEEVHNLKNELMNNDDKQNLRDISNHRLSFMPPQAKSFLNEPRIDLSNPIGMYKNTQQSFKTEQNWIANTRYPKFDFPQIQPRKLEKVKIHFKEETKQNESPEYHPQGLQNPQSNLLLNKDNNNESRVRLDKISQAINAMLSPEPKVEPPVQKTRPKKQKETEEVPKENKLIESSSIDKSLNDSNLKFSKQTFAEKNEKFSSNLNSSTDFFINNRRIPPKKYPEPEDIDDNISHSSKNKKMNTSLSMISESNNLKDSITDNIEYINDNIENFELMHNLK